MNQSSLAVTLSRCDQCGFEASTEYLVRGKCEPCRKWKDTAGPKLACYDTKGGARKLPPPPEVLRYITVRKALARARESYGYVPRFIVNIVRLNTKRSGSMEAFPVTKLPAKLHAKKVRNLLRAKEAKAKRTLTSPQHDPPSVPPTGE